MVDQYFFVPFLTALAIFAVIYVVMRRRQYEFKDTSKAQLGALVSGVLVLLVVSRMGDSIAALYPWAAGLLVVIAAIVMSRLRKNERTMFIVLLVAAMFLFSAHHQWQMTPLAGA